MAAGTPLNKVLSLNVGCRDGLFSDKIKQYYHLDKKSRIEDENVRALLDAKSRKQYDEAVDDVTRSLITQFGVFLKNLSGEGFVLLLLQECPAGEAENMFEALFSDAGYSCRFGRESGCGVAWLNTSGLLSVGYDEHVAPNYFHVEFNFNGFQLNVFSCHLSGYIISDYNDQRVDEQRNDRELVTILGVANEFHTFARSVKSMLGLEKKSLTILGGDFNSLPEHGTRSQLTSRSWSAIEPQRTAYSGALDQVYLRGAGTIHSIYDQSDIARMYIDAESVSLGCSDHHPYSCGFRFK